MFTKIVVGTDGSETAGSAVALAVELAKESDATLHLVTAFKPSAGVAGGGLAAGSPDSGEAFSQIAAEHVLDKIAGELSGVNVEVHAVSGAPAAAILKAADDVGADLIVVGSKGMQGTRRIIGSVPNSVAHGSNCHVLIAKTQ